MTKPTCNRCGAIKIGSYVKETLCGTCKGETKKQLRIKRRAEKGLPEWGSGRDPKCKDCREPKEEAYKNGNYCGKCKCAREKIRYEQKKKELGILSSAKKGRNPFCTKCSKKKQNEETSYCRKCEATRQREWRWTKKQDPELLAFYREKYVSKFADNLSRETKLACRIETRKLIFKGLLKYAPCEICGSTKDIQVHHEDYTKPLEVKWLCRTHHAWVHKRRKIVDNDSNS